MYLQSGLRSNPAGGAYSAPPDPLAAVAVGEETPKNPFPAVGFRPRILASGVPPTKDMGSVSKYTLILID